MLGLTKDLEFLTNSTGAKCGRNPEFCLWAKGAGGCSYETTHNSGSQVVPFEAHTVTGSGSRQEYRKKGPWGKTCQSEAWSSQVRVPATNEDSYWNAIVAIFQSHPSMTCVLTEHSPQWQRVYTSNFSNCTVLMALILQPCLLLLAISSTMSWVVGDLLVPLKVPSTCEHGMLKEDQSFRKVCIFSR